VTLDEFRRQMESYRQSADEEAISLKDSYLALDRLHALYRKFDADEREMADQVLAEWAISEDERVRFDALALIDDFKITRAMTALRQLASRLASSSAVSAPYELKKVNRIIEDLGAGGRTSSASKATK
jgi:cysteinyl-tRNA synthetase